MQEWSLLIGVIALAITTVGVIATILNVEKSTARVALLLLLGCVGVFAIGTVGVGIAKWPPANSSPTPTPTTSPSPMPSPTPTPSVPTPTPPLTPTPQLPTTPSEVKTTVNSPGQALPPEEGSRSRRSESPQTKNNDIGKSKTNDYYEITIENARITTEQVRLDGCHVPVAPGQKALVVRFAIRRLSYKQLTAEESFRTGAVKPTDFVIVDPSNRRIDPACQNFSIFVSERPNTKSLVFLVGADSRVLNLRFQKAATGNISFDLSGLD